MVRDTRPVPRPLAVAHRAGNSLPALREAAALRADVLELDVQSHRGRLEVRHARTAGTLLLWDGWRVQPGWGRRLQLADVLAEALRVAGPATRLMLDLKGDDPRVGAAVVAAVHAVAPGRPVIVCGRHWPTLDPFLGVDDVQVLYSAGTRREVTALLAGLGTALRPRGAVLHHSLLTRTTAARLHGELELLLTWPINDDASLDRALQAGADGVITDERRILERVLALPAS